MQVMNATPAPDASNPPADLPRHAPRPEGADHRQSSVPPGVAVTRTRRTSRVVGLLAGGAAAILGLVVAGERPGANTAVGTTVSTGASSTATTQAVTGTPGASTASSTTATTAPSTSSQSATVVSGGSSTR